MATTGRRGINRASAAWQGRMWGHLVAEALRYPLQSRDQRRRVVDAHLRAREQYLPQMRLEEVTAGSPDTEPLELAAIEQRPHNCTIFELATLGILVRQTKPARAFEIGTYDGRGTLAIASNAPTAEVVTLNLPPDYREYATGADNPDVLLSVQVKSGERFLQHPAAAHITQVYGNSRTFDFTPYRPCQFVFIDGAHDHVTAMQDSRSALSIVDRNHGLIAWHDATHFGVRDVTRALLAEGLPLRLIQGTDIAILRWINGRPVADV